MESPLTPFIANGKGLTDLRDTLHPMFLTIQKIPSVRNSLFGHSEMGGHIIGVRISQIFIRTEKLSPISSEWHLAEQQIAVPDLLPTQGDNLLDAKILQKNEMSKEKLEKKTPTLTGRRFQNDYYAKN